MPNYTRKLNIQKIKGKLKDLQFDDQSRSNEELDHILNQIMDKSDGNDSSMQKIQALHDNMIDRIETKKGHLPEKYFMERNSLLTDLVELPHLNTMRNYFIAIWLTLVTNAVITDLVRTGKVSLRAHQLPVALTNCHMAIFIWICMFTSTVAVYYAFYFWGAVRVNYISKTKSPILKVWDNIGLLFFVTYCFSFFHFSIRAITDNSLQIMLSTILIGETIRLFMKSYAFVRSNTPRALKYKLHDEDKVLCPEFSKFLYFSFAPTLVYRDDYPRTSHIRWNYVALYCTEFTGAFLCMHFIQEYILVPSFENYDLKMLTWQDVIMLMSRNMLPNFLYWTCNLFAVFHALQNSFAETMQFADRLFYKDWWNSTSGEKIYTNFSVAVYDWLYTYVYKDMHEIVLPRNKFAAKTVEIITITVLHELVFSFPYRFYYILMAIFYVFAFPMLHLYRHKNYFLVNICFLYGIMCGITILRTGLTLEYYVRLSCPIENASLLSYFIPRTFTCNLYEENHLK